MVLSQAVAIADVGVVDAVQHHVHAADAQHGGVEIKAVEQAVMEVLARGIVAQRLGVVGADILAGGDQKAGGAAGRVHDHVARGGRGHRHHQRDDVARGAELPVLTGGGDLAEHVLVQVALGVAIGHRQVGQHVDHAGEQSGGGGR